MTADPAARIRALIERFRSDAAVYARTRYTTAEHAAEAKGKAEKLNWCAAELEGLLSAAPRSRNREERDALTGVQSTGQASGQ